MSDTPPWRVKIGSVHDALDVDDLARLRYEWRAGERGERGLDDGEFRDQFAQWWRAHESSHVAFVGREGDTAVAMAWLAIVDRVPGPGAFVRRCAYVQSVYVARDMRNAGRGSSLVSALVAHARREELDYLAVHPSEFSFPFYRRLGFDPTSRVLELDFRPRVEPF